MWFSRRHDKPLGKLKVGGAMFRFPFRFCPAVQRFVLGFPRCAATTLTNGIANHCRLLARCTAAVLLMGMGMMLVSFSQSPGAGTAQPTTTQQSPIAAPVEDRNPLGPQTSLLTSPENPAVHDELYWLAEQEKVEADRQRLQAELEELNHKIDAPVLNILRDALHRTDAWIAKEKQLREDAPEFVSPAMARGLDWAIRSAEDHATDLRSQLDARQADLAPEQARLKQQKSHKMNELNSTEEMLKAVVCALQVAQKSHARQNQIEELKALDKLPGGAGARTINAGGVLVNTSKP